MADSPAFEWVSNEIERRTSLSRLQARGTVRLVLKDAGLEPEGVTAAQMAVVLSRLMGPALASRRVDGADGLCADLIKGLQVVAVREDVSPVESPYDVFRRLGRDGGGLNGRKS